MKNYLVMLGLVTFLGAGTITGLPAGRAWQTVRHDTNLVEMCITNFGIFGQAESGWEPGCWWPNGTNHTYIYAAGFWFGTTNGTSADTQVTTGYFPHVGSSEVAPGLSGMSTNHPDAIIYMHPSNWPPPQATFPMAPQIPLSHQDSWCCYNDSDLYYHGPGDMPIGIEVYQTIYVWDVLDIVDIIYFTLDVHNVSGDSLQNCYIGLCADCDVGYAHDDICTGIVDRTYLIGNDTIFVDDLGYQWPGDDPSTWGAIGFDLFQTPFDLVQGQDKDGDGIPDQYERDSVYYVNNLPQYMWDVDNDGVPDWRDPSQWPQLGMTAFKRFTVITEPLNDRACYRSLAGYNHQTGQYEPYDTLIPAPGDQRFLMSSGPFTLEPDSIVTIVFAVLFADWHNIYQTPDTALALIDATAQLYYDMYWFLYTGIQEYTSLERFHASLIIHPNPFNEKTDIEFQIGTSSEVVLEIRDATGRLVRDFPRQTAKVLRPTVLSWDGRDNSGNQLPSGVYFLHVVAENYSVAEKLLLIR